MQRMRVDRSAPLALLIGAALLFAGVCLAEEPAHPAATTAAPTEHVATQEHATTAEPVAADGAAHGDVAATHEAVAAEGAHGEPVAAHGEAAGTHGAAADAHGAAADAHGAAAAHGGGHGTGMPHIPSALTFIEAKLPPAQAEMLNKLKDPIFSLLVALLLAVFFVSLAGKLDARKPGRTQMAVELIFGGLYGLFTTIIGPSARRYTPFLGSLFVFIFCNNLFGMVPLGHSSTSSFANTTFALGMLTFLYVQYIALKENGIGGYLFHMAGSPKTGMEWGFSLLLFPLHVLGELIKPVSLSLRLFGNIFGEDTLMATMVLLGAGIMFKITGGMALVPGIPLQLPFYFLGLLSCTIQALVFTLLATVYIALWLPHGHHAEESHGH
jgi:F-type H+-transporting ATPase subunit a